MISFTLTTYTDEQTYAQLIQQELNATGNFKVKLDVLTEAAYYADGSPSSAAVCATSANSSPSSVNSSDSTAIRPASLRRCPNVNNLGQFNGK